MNAAYVRVGSRAAMPSKSPLRRVHSRKRPCWRRAVTSALGQLLTHALYESSLMLIDKSVGSDGAVHPN